MEHAEDLIKNKSKLLLLLLL